MMNRPKYDGKLKRGLGFLLIFVMLFESIALNSFDANASQTETREVEEENVSSEVTAEDLVISSNYVLTEDMVVNHLTVKAQTLDINGYQLKVLGDITHSGGTIKMNKGEILCAGNYTLNGAGYLSMDNPNDYLKVEKDFTCQTQCSRKTMSAGKIEIKGDFVQKKGGDSEANFIPGGTHEVLFSGNKSQEIHFDSPASYFNKVVLENTSEEGIVCDGLINSLSMERNSTKIAAYISGAYGWKLAEDETYEGDLLLIGGTLDLNGHSLRVKGNLIQMNGIVKVNGGSLMVDKDYRIQRREEQEDEFVYTAASGVLSMLGADDQISVGGDFVTESTVSHEPYLKGGILEVKGDVLQKKYTVADNFAMSSDIVLRLTGDALQRISLQSSGKAESGLADLEVENLAGIELDTDIYVSGNVADHKKPVTGKSLVIGKDTTFTDNHFSGNIMTKEDFTWKNLNTIGGNFTNNANIVLGTDLTVKGDLENTKGLYLRENCLEIKGDAIARRNIYVEQGNLVCGGNLELVSDSNGGGSLVMKDENCYALVRGNVYANSSFASSANMTAGTLELKGDFIHTTPYKKGNFCASGTHVTIFSGDSMQTIKFADNYSYFNIVEIKNTSEEGIYAPNGINCSTLKRNGNKITTDQAGEFGWKLTKDETYEGDLTLIADELDLNGHTLRVTGNLLQPAGIININEGALIVEGDYRIQSEAEQTDGTLTYGESNGILEMTKSGDRVMVEGAFVMGSIYSHAGRLTAGQMTVQGDFSAEKYKAEDNFAATDSHVLILGGPGEQKVRLAQPGFSSMRIANLEINNESDGGAVCENDLPVTGNVGGTGRIGTGCILIRSSTTFEGKQYCGDIVTSGGTRIGNLDVLNGNLLVKSTAELSSSLTVNGNVTIENNYLDLKGNNLKVSGNLCVTSASIRLSGGFCICGGDMTLAYGKSASYLSMDNEADHVCVNGDFYARSISMPLTAMRAGTLELKGDFIQEKTMNGNNFVVTGDCKVILSGEGLQTVDFSSEQSYFAYTEITNTSEEGVFSEEGIHCQYLETNGNVYRTGKEGERGWKLEKDEVWNGDLVLATGTLDLQGHKLTVNGNLIQKGGNVAINGGVLEVNGNYTVGEPTVCDGEETIRGSWATLLMQKGEDEVYVRGDFTMASFAGHSGYLTAGTLHLSGDLIQICTESGQNLATTDGFTLVLEGNDVQNVEMETAHTKYSRIANLEIDNSGNKDVFLNGMLVTGNVMVKRGIPQGELCAVATTVFQNEFYPGDVSFQESTVYERELKIKGYLNCTASFTMKADVTVDGNMRASGYFNVNGRTLQVNGDTNIYGTSILINKGSLLCGGTMYLEYRDGVSSGLEMKNSEDYVLVGGDMKVDTARNFVMNKGTLELKGDFVQNRYQNKNAFLPAETFVTIFSGDKKQTVCFSDSGSGFGTVSVRNQSAEGIYFENDRIPAAVLERNGCRVRCAGIGTYGWTLTEDTVIEDDLYIIMDELDLNGHTLTINGNLYVGAGSVNINGGTLDVSGDFRLQAYDGNGTYSASNGTLVMIKEDDKVKVGGNFVTQTAKNEQNYLTAGTMEIKGNFSQLSVSSFSKNFPASGNHKVKFTGDGEQTVCFDSYTGSYFNKVSFSDSQKGITFLSNVKAIGEIEDAQYAVGCDLNKCMYVDQLSQFKDGKFGGNVNCSQSSVLKQDMSVDGALYSNGDIDLNGHILSAGAFEKSDRELFINGGKLCTEGDMKIHSGAYLVMSDKRDKICVKGDFAMSSSRNLSLNVMDAGTLEISGDVQIQTSGFAPSGSHRTVLSGKTGTPGRDYIQSVSILNTKFNELVLTKEKNRFYAFSDEVGELCHKLTVEISDQEPPSQVAELQVQKTTATTVQLNWAPSKDDKEVSGYRIFRGSRQIGTTGETNYTDMGLKPDCKYQYTVCAFDGAGNLSESSDIATAVTERDTEAPSSPEGMKILTQTGSSITIDWKKARDNAGVSGYYIYRDDEKVAELNEKTTRFKDINRKPEEEHTYQVSAFDEAGNESKRSESVTGAAQMPRITRMIPKDGGELGGNQAELFVYYENPGNSTGNKVKFEYSMDGGEHWEDINLSLLGQNEFDRTTLYSNCIWDISKVKGSECSIRATLYDADENTDVKVISCHLDTEAPEVPECVNVECNNGVVEISWNPSNSANCVGYEVYRTENGGESVCAGTIAGRENTRYTDTGVKSGETYTYFVRAVDCFAQISDESEKVTVIVDEDKAEPKVLSVTASQKKICKNTVFTVKAEDNIGVSCVSMQYLCKDKWIDIGTGSGAEGKIKFSSGMPADGEYTFRAIAEDSSGNQSEEYRTKFTVDTTGTEKVTISDVDYTSDKVRITWNTLKDNDFGYCSIEQLKDGAFTEIMRESSKSGVYIRNLDPGTEYTFRIVGYDDIGNRGEPSDEISFTTYLDTVSPHIMKFDPVISYYQELIPIQIEAKDNNELGRLELSYSLDRKAWVSLEDIEAPKNRREFTYEYDMDIREFNEGSIYIRAVLYDRAGNATSQNAVIREFYKDLTAPEPPEDISAKSHSGYVEVKWKRPSDKDFASFDLYRLDARTGEYVCIERNTTALNYFDTLEQDGKVFTYKLAINDQAGNKSELSKEVSAQILPDLEPPEVYGISPSNQSIVGKNPQITVLVADNRCLGEVSVEYRKKGGRWNELYRKNINAESRYIDIQWKNEGLEQGNYEFRVLAEDTGGNTGKEYVCTYTFDENHTEEPKETGGGAMTTTYREPEIALPSNYSLRQGKEETFVAEKTAGNAGIVSWKWDFGNGDTAVGEKVDYAYSQAGTYTLTLTVKDATGKEVSATSSVVVLSKSCGGVEVKVASTSGSTLGNAQVYIQKTGEKRGTDYTCDTNGELKVSLNSGTYKVSAYISGYLPVEKQVKITPGAIKKVNFELESNELITGTLTHRRLDVREIVELGIDLEDEENWYTYTYEVVTYLRGDPTPKIYKFNVSQGKIGYVKLDGGRTLAYAVAGGDEPGKQVLVRYETVRYLKKMFGVELRLQNHAGKEFTVTDGEAELELPDGLSLAGMTGHKQSTQVNVPDVQGQSEQVVNWYIRGDEPGEYFIRANYKGVLQPFHAPVDVTIYDKDPVVVTQENDNTNTDPGFLDEDKETRDYQIAVHDISGKCVEGAYVEMWYKDKSTRGITDGDGLVHLQVNEGDDRTFRLTVQCHDKKTDYKDYEDNNYKIDLDYMDSIRIVPVGGDSYEDENEDYEGDFTLDYATVNGENVFDTRVVINKYQTEINTVKLIFNENVSEASIMLKGRDANTYAQVVEKNELSSKVVTLKFSSDKLLDDYSMYVRAVDKKTRSWHIYCLENVKIIHKEPNYDMAGYSQDLAEQCALYAALAYRKTIKEEGGYTDGFTYDIKNKRLSSQDPNSGYIDLKMKLNMDGFLVDDKYMYQNYSDNNRDNCSYSIVSCEAKKEVYVYIIIRGTDGVEWFGNMKCTGEKYSSNQKDHYSFRNGMEVVKKRLEAYLVEKNLESANIVITGHSRGAAVANLLAKEMIDMKNGSIAQKGKTKTIKSVCSYNFATPNCTLSKSTNLGEYSTIFNFCFEDDFVPQVPMSNWGYNKYGITFSTDSEELFNSNLEYKKLRAKIRPDKKFSYNALGTKDLVDHLSTYWKNVEEYYNTYYKLAKIADIDQKISLFEYMHNIVATALEGNSKEQIMAGKDMIFSMVKVDFVKVLLNVALSDKMYDDYTNVFGKISEYFFKGSDKVKFFCRDYIFSTHHADNYYAALLCDGFQVKSKDNLRNYTLSNIEDKDRDKNPEDVNIFKRVIEQKIAFDTEKGVKYKSVAEVLGWDIDDVLSWKGVTFEDGYITRISLNQSCFRNLKLDLSGLTHLEELYCVYTRLGEIVLDDCKALKKITLMYNNIQYLDIRNCENLAALDVRYNELKGIQFSNQSNLLKLKCSGNYMDIDSDKNLLQIVKQVLQSGGIVDFENQLCQEGKGYSTTDKEVIQNMLKIEDNATYLGWDSNNIDTWTGVEWKTVSGTNYVKSIDIAYKQLEGFLDVTDLKYLEVLKCGGNNFSKVDVSGCTKLVYLDCMNCKLSSLSFSNTDNLLYLYCAENYLIIDEIEEYCKKVSRKAGSDVTYKQQFIMADRLAFNEKECEELERFASYQANNLALDWNMNKPGIAKGITWGVKNGQYRVEKINLIGCAVFGELNLSSFTNLKEFSCVSTGINKIILPSNLKDVSDKSFLNCRNLKEVSISEGVERIGKEAFRGCINLEEMVLPASVKEINDNAFESCDKLKKIIIKGNLEILSNYAFCGCTNLVRLEFMEKAPSLLGKGIFLGVPKELSIYTFDTENGWDNPYWKEFNLVSIQESPERTPNVVNQQPIKTKLPEKTVVPIKTSEPSGTNLPDKTNIPSDILFPNQTDKDDRIWNSDISSNPGESFINNNREETGKKQLEDYNVQVDKKEGDKGDVDSDNNCKQTEKMIKVKTLKCISKRRTIILKWKRNKRITGYEVYYRKGKRGKFKVIRIKGWKKNTIILRKLSLNSKYYVKVRAYKIMEKRRYYSEFSKLKKACTKK